jgi:hypothetical protein
MAEPEAVAILEAERTRVALLTRRGIGMPMAGFFFWIAMALFVRTLPERTGPATTVLPPRSTSMVKIDTDTPEAPIELAYKVTNFLVAPGKCYELSLTIGE